MSRPRGWSQRDCTDAPAPPPTPDTPFQIVFVCTGNICRSPMAEVITRTMATATTLGDRQPMSELMVVSSAGTGPWHEGEPMDPRTADALARAGYPPHAHFAHQVATARLGQFDMMVALDRRHLQTLRGLGADPSRLFLLRSFDKASGAAADVPDPYYGDEIVFDDCLALIEAGCRGLVATLAARWETDALPVT